MRSWTYNLFVGITIAAGGQDFRQKKRSPAGTKHAAFTYRTQTAVGCVICISFYITIERNSLGHTAAVLQDDGFLHPCVALNKFYLQCASSYRSQSQSSPDHHLCGQQHSVHLLLTVQRPVEPVLRLISKPTYLLLTVRLFCITVHI